MKLATHNKEDSMIRLVTAPILFFIPLEGFDDERQREIEYETINHVIKKYGKGLESRLKGTGANLSYRSWYENDFFCKYCSRYLPRRYLVGNEVV